MRRETRYGASMLDPAERASQRERLLRPTPAIRHPNSGRKDSFLNLSGRDSVLRACEYVLARIPLSDQKSPTLGTMARNGASLMRGMRDARQEVAAAVGHG